MKSISSSFDKVQKKKAFQYVKIIFSSNLKVIFFKVWTCSYKLFVKGWKRDYTK